MKKIVNEKILCACHCGIELYKFDDYGRSRKFIHGHNMNKNHPTNPLLKRCKICGKWDLRSNLNSRIFHNGCRKSVRREDRKYRIIIEKILGKEMPQNAVVHHIDGDRSNNSNNNLVVCDSTAYHALIHKRTRALKVSGDVNKRKCLMCGEYDSIDKMRPKKQSGCKGLNYYHIECSRKRYDPYKRHEAWIRTKSYRFATEDGEE